MESNITPSRRITLEGIRACRDAIDPVFRDSPQYAGPALSAALGCELVVKVETANPVRCFKGRGSEVYMARHAALHPGAPAVCASAGNFGQAMAWSARKRGVQMIVYAATGASPLKVSMIRALGAEVRQTGEDFDAAKMAGRTWAAETGHRFAEDSLDIETVEGAGTMGLELATLDRPLDALLVSLGNGAMFNGIATAMKALAPATEMVAVQSAGAPAMVESYRSGQLVTHDSISTIADGIGVRLPVQVALDDMAGLADETLLVEDTAIIEAMRLLHRHLGLVVEPSGAAGVAAVLADPARYKGKRIGTIICGGNLTEAQMADWLR